MEDRVFRVLVSKLGIAGDTGPIIRKASELKRLISLKTNASTGFAHLSETSIVVFCLDLAASGLGSTIDRATGARLSRLTKPAYQRTLHSLRKILGIETNVTIESLTVALGVTDVARTASDILESYRLGSDKSKNGTEDLSHPVYLCAAIKVAAKRMKAPIDRSSLVDSSRVKSSELEKLAAKMAAFYEAKRGSETDKTRRKRKADRPKGFLEEVEEVVRESEKNAEKSNGNQQEDLEEEATESLEDWKKRILGE